MRQNRFYCIHYNDLKDIYLKIPLIERENITLFSRKIILKRKQLIAHIKNNNHKDFDSLLWDFINSGHIFYVAHTLESNATYFGEDDMTSVENLTSLSSSLTFNMKERQQMRKWSEKQKSFIENFATQMDKAYRLAACISSGELIKPPDNFDQTMGMLKNIATNILPNIHVSPAMMMGLPFPLPISIDIPSGLIVAAMIDFCLLLRTWRQGSQAKRIASFFDQNLLRDRTEKIYQFAESIARQWKLQINVLHIVEIKHFAEVVAARVIRYFLVGNDKSNNPWVLITLLRKGLSTFFPDQVGPQPEATYKPLAQFATEAASQQAHLVFLNDAETRPLTLDDEYKDISRNDPLKQWTAKGLLENAGIRTPDSAQYKGAYQNVEKYGYRIVDSNEVEESIKGKVRVDNSESIWFEKINQNIYSTQKSSSALFFESSTTDNNVNNQNRNLIQRPQPFV